MEKIEEARANEESARKIHELRTAAGITQTQLAKPIGATASVICRLEDADYEGHSLAMLRRIGGALNQRVKIRFVPVRRWALAYSPAKGYHKIPQATVVGTGSSGVLVDDFRTLGFPHRALCRDTGPALRASIQRIDAISAGIDLG
ncbi:hypothetical protein SBA4_260002 [Candidatus Sulfopaludibacter sp. SbA4]|nr:hypothetical protein SBA4_260002 [Candidatus Sulfopaludibacter sp. SbA4]